MIVNLKKYEGSYIFKIISMLRLIFYTLISYKKIQSLMKDSQHLDNYFIHKFPMLRKDINKNLLCVSCELCVDICPTKALKIEKGGMMDIPQTFTTGEVPKSFHLDLEKCIKCHLCSDICFVDAIELTGDYVFEDKVVNLIETTKLG